MEQPLPPPPRVEMSDELRRWLNSIPALIPKIQTFMFVLDPANINATTVSTQSFTASGLTVNDFLYVSASLTAGLVLSANARSPSADKLEITIYNATGGAINQASTTFNVVTIR